MDVVWHNDKGVQISMAEMIGYLLPAMHHDLAPIIYLHFPGDDFPKNACPPKSAHSDKISAGLAVVEAL